MRIRIYIEHVREMSAYIDCLASLRSGRLALLLLRLGHEGIVPAFIVHFGDEVGVVRVYSLLFTVQ